MQTIAIVNTKNTNLIEALKATLAKRFKNTQILVFAKIAEAPVDAKLASFGMPSYMPGSSPRKVINIGTRMVDGDEERKAQWELIRDENSSPEEIMAELGACVEYTIIPQAASLEAKVEYAEALGRVAELKAALVSEENQEEREKIHKEIESALGATLKTLKTLID